MTYTCSNHAVESVSVLLICRQIGHNFLRHWLHLWPHSDGVEILVELKVCKSGQMSQWASFISSSFHRLTSCHRNERPENKSYYCFRLESTRDMDTVRRALARGLFMTGDGHYESLDTGHQCYIHPQSVSGQSSSIRSRRRVMVHTSRTYDYWMNLRLSRIQFRRSQ